MDIQIPEMTDPLGRYWNQPRDIRSAPISDTEILITRRQFDELAEYSTSMPTGAYEGKCWKRQEYERVGHGENMRLRYTGRWHLGFYGHSDKPGYVSNNWRLIHVVD